MRELSLQQRENQLILQQREFECAQREAQLNSKNISDELEARERELAKRQLEFETAHGLVTKMVQIQHFDFINLIPNESHQTSPLLQACHNNAFRGQDKNQSDPNVLGNKQNDHGDAPTRSSSTNLHPTSSRLTPQDLSVIESSLDHKMTQIITKMAQLRVISRKVIGQHDDLVQQQIKFEKYQNDMKDEIKSQRDELYSRQVELKTHQEELRLGQAKLQDGIRELEKREEQLLAMMVINKHSSSSSIITTGLQPKTNLSPDIESRSNDDGCIGNGQGDSGQGGDTTTAVMKMVCDYCASVGVELKLCSVCRSVAYCSVSCQKKDWIRVHSQVCARRQDEKGVF